MRPRDEFFNLLYPEFIKNENIYVLYADVGCQGLDQFRSHPRCINVGIAEQNMIAVACGLATEGKRVYCFTIQAFYLRAVEQIKILVDSMHLPIMLVGCGKDKYYARDGISHWAIEDTYIFSYFKYLRICDGPDINGIFKKSLIIEHPMYIRLAN